MKIFGSIILLFASMATLSSCKKDCYDKALEEQFYTIDCTADCPGVVGCDGKTYCNECIANSHGIRVE
ncbi:MAG: hypothetical protein GC178_10740 [Flavobacteriales bacterium]|nr:hypothetical protein [Flavobacteriales bacterium]